MFNCRLCGINLATNRVFDKISFIGYDYCLSCTNSICSHSSNFIDLGPINQRNYVVAQGTAQVPILTNNVTNYTSNPNSIMKVAPNGVVSFYLACPHGLPEDANCDLCCPRDAMGCKSECECGTKQPLGQGHSTWCEMYKSEF